MSDEPSEERTDVGTKLQLRPNERLVRLQKPRLRRDDYVGRRTYHVTIATVQRAPVFEDLEIGRWREHAIVDACDKLQFALVAYCFMRDHVHFLLAGKDHASDLLKLVQRFKQVTAHHFRALSGDRLWQQSFFDRVLRQDEDPMTVARYIFDSPQADGLDTRSPAYLLRGGEFLSDVASDGAEASSLHLDSRGSSSGARYNPLEGRH